METQDSAEFQWHDVCAADEIASGSADTFELGGKIVAVFNHQGNLHAMDDACPHMGASLSAGDVQDFEVSCPLHAWRFDIRDGTWCDNRRVKIGAYETRIEQGRIQIRMPVQTDD